MNIFSYVSRQYWKFRVRLASGTLSRLDSSMKKAGMTRTELLEACEQIQLECLGGTHDTGTKGIAMLHAAIRKAKGE